MTVELVSRPAIGPMVDPFGRHVTYLRVSVTDRCDFRCVYCMSEHMTFLPKKDLLTLEELDRLCSAFVARGVRKLRITGGEPLVRKNILWLFHALSRHLGSGALDELTLTTNGSQLPEVCAGAQGPGVRRINISLDTLKADRFRAITRWGDFSQVMAGIEAAERAGLNIKLNAVALKGVNEDEYDDLIALRAWPWHRPDADRDHADGRDRWRPDRPVSTALDRARAPHGPLDAARHPLPHRRPGTLRRGQGDGRAARVHHTDDA